MNVWNEDFGTGERLALASKASASTPTAVQDRVQTCRELLLNFFNDILDSSRAILCAVCMFNMAMQLLGISRAREQDSECHESGPYQICAIENLICNNRDSARLVHSKHATEKHPRTALRLAVESAKNNGLPASAATSLLPALLRTTYGGDLNSMLSEHWRGVREFLGPHKLYGVARAALLICFKQTCNLDVQKKLRGLFVFHDDCGAWDGECLQLCAMNS